MRYLASIISILILSVQCVHAENKPDDGPYTLYIFLLDECRISIQYTALLNSLHAEYGDEVDFIGVFPNFASKPEAIKAWAETYGLPFPTQTDYFKKLCRKFDAKVTPEVVLYDEASETILYKGRIDNQYASLGKRRPRATQHDLHDALAALSHGTSYEPSVTEAVGCYINYHDLD